MAYKTLQYRKQRVWGGFYIKNNHSPTDSHPHATRDFATINQGLCKRNNSACTNTNNIWLLLLLKLERRLAVETQPHHLRSNHSFFHLPFVFVDRVCACVSFFFSSPSPFPPCSAGDLWMAANGRVESPQPLSLPDIHSEKVMQRDWDAQLRWNNGQHKAAANGYTWLRRAPSTTLGKFST